MFWKISFDVVVEGPKGQADLDLTLSICERRGAIYKFHHTLNHLYVPEEFDPTPFRQTLEACGAVNWVVKHPVKCLKSSMDSPVSELKVLCQ